MKAVSIVLIVAGLAAIVAALGTAPSAAPHRQPLPAVAMRGFGTLPAAAPAEAPPSAAAPAPAPAAEPNREAPRPGGKALEKALERAAEKPSDDLAPPEKAEKPEKAEPKAEHPPEHVARPAEAKPAEHPRPAEREDRPAERAAPPPAPKGQPALKSLPDEPAGGADEAPAAGPAFGVLNLRASDTADVFVDGKKAGGSPQLGFKVKPGKHKVRFDCYQPTGETKPGITQTYDVAKDGQRDVDYECP